MYLVNHDMHDCCGCGACFNVCPKKCITMKEDQDGFMFPEIDRASCINCHLCEKVCPEEVFPEIAQRLETPVISAVIVKDEALLLKSASGGAFTEIVHWFLSKGDGYIYGAVWDENLKVKHICSWNDEHLGEIRGSKYVMSDLGECFAAIKQQLQEGYRVLFSGTPCQVAAVRNYIGANENLICIDLVCHGVPSQKLFDDYIAEEESRLKKKIIKVGFHHKIYRKKWTSRNILITTEDGKKIERTRYQSDYLRAYHPCLMNRESCYECRYSKPERYGDITIGDFWGITRFYQQLIVERGVSIVQVNTKVGAEILEYLKNQMEYYTIDRSKYLKLFGNSLAKSGGPKKNPKRSRFLAEERQYGFHKAVTSVFPMRKDYFSYCAGELKRSVKSILKSR